MRTDSAKKSKLQPNLARQIESKLLITTKCINFLSNSISSKLDNIRMQQHQQQLNRQYNRKFMTDRKRINSNSKILSHSKVNTNDPKVNTNDPKANTNDLRKERDHSRGRDKSTNLKESHIQPKKLIFDEEDYRQKYNQLHEEYINIKHQRVQQSEKIFALKDTICEFTYSPSQQKARTIGKILQSQKVEDAMRKILLWKKRCQVSQNVLSEAMQILQVDNWQQLINNLRGRIERFRNLDQCTFKILELESINKKIVNQFEERYQQNKQQIEESNKQQLQLVKEELAFAKQAQLLLERQLQAERCQQHLVLSDLSKLSQLQNEQITFHWDSQSSEVAQLYKMIKNLKNKVRDIEMEAEENMIRLLNSNKDMVKLERLMGELKDDMNQQIQEEENKNQLNLKEIQALTNNITALEEELTQCKETIKQAQSDKQKRQNQIYDQYRLISSFLGTKETNAAKIIIKIQENYKESAAKKAQVEQLKLQINEKDEHLRQKTLQLQKGGHLVNELKQTTKAALFQKDEYKFLLNNLRDQVSHMKKQHSQEKQKLNKQKQQEIARSNQEILESHNKLNDMNNDLRQKINVFRKEYEEQRANAAFLQKQAEHLQKIIQEKEQQNGRLMEESQRYRKYLKQIQSSFKEVVELEQVSSKKVIVLETEKNQHTRFLQNIKTKNQQLQLSNNQLTQRRNHIKMQLDRCVLDVKELREERCKLESANVELRLDVIAKQNEINRLEEEYKTVAKQAKNNKLANQKLIGEINSVTRKLILVKMDIKKQIGQTVRKCSQTVAKTKNQIQSIKTAFNQQLRKTLFVVQNQQNAFTQLSEANELKIKFLIDENRQLKFIERNIRMKEQECQLLKQKAIVSVETNEVGQQYEYTNKIDCDCQCQLDQEINSNRNGLIKFKLAQIAQQITSINQQKKQLLLYLTQIHVSAQQCYKNYQQFIQNQKDNQAYNQKDNQKQSIQVHPPLKTNKKQHGIHPNKDQYDSFQSIDSVQDAHIISFSPNTARQIQGDNVNSILQILIDSQTDIPTVPYWQKIQTNFILIRKKLCNRSKINLKLDISAIDHRDPSLCSPNAQSVFNQKDFLHRLDSQSDEIQQYRQAKDTNRSQKISISANDNLRRQLQQLKLRLFESEERNRKMELELQQKDSGESRINEIGQLKKKIVLLQNETSIIGLQSNFKKLLDYIISQNYELFEKTCRIIMKMLHYSTNEIKDYQDHFNNKKKKKKGGLFAGLFK